MKIKVVLKSDHIRAKALYTNQDKIDKRKAFGHILNPHLSIMSCCSRENIQTQCSLARVSMPSHP